MFDVFWRLFKSLPPKVIVQRGEYISKKRSADVYVISFRLLPFYAYDTFPTSCVYRLFICRRADNGSTFSIKRTSLYNENVAYLNAPDHDADSCIVALYLYPYICVCELTLSNLCVPYTFLMLRYMYVHFKKLLLIFKIYIEDA